MPALKSEFPPKKTANLRASVTLKGLIVILLDIDTVKASIATPTAKNKLDRKDND
jgi:hypothetical protein